MNERMHVMRCNETYGCMYMHTCWEQGQGFLSCHCVCLIAVRIDNSYEYEKKMAAIKGISRYASCPCFFNTFCIISTHLAHKMGMSDINVYYSLFWFGQIVSMLFVLTGKTCSMWTENIIQQTVHEKFPTVISAIFSTNWKKKITRE